MKKIILLIFILSVLSCFEKDETKIVVEKQFRNNNTYEIICNGWPKEDLTGRARLESAKEAALINAQFTAREIFEKPVDVVRNGTIEKYDINNDYVTIYYVITYRNLKKYIKE